MRTSLHKYVLYLAVAACLYAAFACAALKKAGWTAGGAAAGGAGGALVGGPAGAAVGAAAGAVTASTVGDNDSLLSGNTIGKEALEAEGERKLKEMAAQLEMTRKMLHDRPVVYEDKPVWPWWLLRALIGGAIYLVWTKGHHILRFLRGQGVGNLLNIVLPSWAQKSKKAQPGI